MNLIAEENNLSINSNSLFLHNNWLNSEITFFSSETSDSRVSAHAAGWLNILLGLGSFIQGDIGGGFLSLGLHGVGWGIFAYAFASGNADTELGYTLGSVAGVFFVGGLIWGFVRPNRYENRVRTARLDDLRNWDVALVRNRQGDLGGQIAFTAHF